MRESTFLTVQSRALAFLVTFLAIGAIAQTTTGNGKALAHQVKHGWIGLVSGHPCAAVAKALTDAGVEVTMKTIAVAGHEDPQFRNPENQRLVEEFLSQKLKLAKEPARESHQ